MQLLNNDVSKSNVHVCMYVCQYISIFIIHLDLHIFFTYCIGHLYSNWLFLFGFPDFASGCCKDGFSGWKLRISEDGNLSDGIYDDHNHSYIPSMYGM